MKNLSCDIDEFSERMRKKYETTVQQPKTQKDGTVKLVDVKWSLIQRNLDEESDSNTIVTSGRFDPGEIDDVVESRVSEWSKLGKIRKETWQGGMSDETIEGFLTLKDPCDEKLVDEAIKEDFVWL
jgi:hypothetical protein